MQKVLVIAMCGMLSLAVWGCNKNKHESSTSSAPAAKSADACSHCPGNQTATANGTCPACGAKVKS